MSSVCFELYETRGDPPDDPRKGKDFSATDLFFDEEEEEADEMDDDLDLRMCRGCNFKKPSYIKRGLCANPKCAPGLACLGGLSPKEAFETCCNSSTFALYRSLLLEDASFDFYEALVNLNTLSV